MLGTVDEIDYDGDRVRKVVVRFPALRAGDSATVKEVRACERIGQGSFGTVYRAVCEGYPRLALKISTGKSTRLRQELDVLSRVCTKGRLLLPRFEFGALNKTADLIVVGMELCVPSTLHDLLLSTRITSEAEMLFMAYQAVQAVSYVHEEGCIHRDIKLQNFVFDLDGNLKLIDFGLACNSLSPPAGDVVAGTVSFMSPEMAHNALHKEKRVSVGVAADVWSLGIVLFSIFTQRNPYPSAEAAARHRSASTEATPQEIPNSCSGAHNKENKNDVGAQQRLNERLLRRVAAGDWQWPVGVGVSQDLKQLVNSILIASPEKRPTVEQILQNKLWNLRRRYPPAAVAAFLGVQDDFLLSHDDAHLMRAVEERSAGVTASLLHSRVQSPDHASSSSSSNNNNGADGSRNAHTIHSHSSHSQNVEEQDKEVHQQLQQHVPGTTTPPVRSSLKVVQRGGEGGVDGAVAVQVYDVRASTRKRSKPIREISIVMAEETAKRRQSRSGRRGQIAAASAPSSRRPSRAASAAAEGDEEVKEEPRRASSAGASLWLQHSTVPRTSRAMFLDDRVDEEAGKTTDEEIETSDEDVVEIPRPLGRAASKSGSKSVSKSCSRQRHASKNSRFIAEEGEDSKRLAVQEDEEDATDNAADNALTKTSVVTSAPVLSGSSQPLIPTTASATESKPSAALQREEGQRSGSVELVEISGSTDEAAVTTQGKQRLNGTHVNSKSRTAPHLRSRDTSLRQTSSSILHGVTQSSSKSLPTAKETATKPQLVVDSATQDAQAFSAAKPVVSRSSSFPSKSDSRGIATAPPARRVAPLPSKRAQRVALELSLDVVWQDEADHRRNLSSALLIEHAWLLASFRLTIEEDQERYNITWLAEEQEKSAAHPHRFKEMTRVTSKKYQYGFVCDLCDYEFLPDGPDEKDLHYFHCPCGRDLCPDCFEEYQRQCTCSCCHVVHPNSCVLREHLLQTGGSQLYRGLRGIARGTAAPHVDGRGTYQSAPAATQNDDGMEYVPAPSSPPQLQPKRRNGRPRGSDALVGGNTTTTPPASQNSIRAGKDTGRRRRGKGGRDGGEAGRSAAALDVDVEGADEVAQIHPPRMSIAAMQQERVATAKPSSASPSSESRSLRGRAADARANGAADVPQRPEDLEVKQRPVEHLPEGPWRPFARFKKDRKEAVARQPTPEERDALLNGDWIRYFYLFPNSAADAGRGAVDAEDPYAFVYHAQPGRTGAIFLTSDFPMHSAVFSMLERQFFVVDQVDTVDGADSTRATSLLRAKGQPDMKIAFQALQDIVAYDTNMMKQQRTPGTVSVYQAPRSAYSCNGEPFLYVRWFRFNEDRTLSAFLLSNGAVQVFVNNEYELRWFDETRKFLIRYNGVCELVEDNAFTLAPAINHLLYDSFDG
ncbi:putative protein kinase [Leptomonas pyrrhocoris]|uniref:Protein kinase domain-containing protein n=1 Tax=Leptomonas pyrrhocoris TaxID=157538 RepID=A0A0N0E0I8_LEPPY|nr:putative protein kinase [Leptomonas pyrrhocoris]KPA86492.1 putative protein kinase [Leptomonas pyrrhocoris]|eukprot:XP_015664931.1 putative protein kinase [Leptomonas pyrrhocoris]